MTKIHVIHENDQWFEPIRKVLDERKIPYASVFLASGAIDINKPPEPGVYFNKMSASSFTRDHAHSPDYAAAYLAWLESWGARVINPLRVLHLEMSKAEQYARLRQAGINVPRAVACFGKRDILEKAKQFK